MYDGPMLREPTYFILAALLDGPLHGYAIIRRAAELSDGAVRPTAGTLYGALDRLSAQGLVAADREETVSGRRRRYYRLTAAGDEALTAEAERMRRAAAAVERRPRGLSARSQPA
jgi:DNA-binding PadR family transcriptional regulator